MLRLSSNYESRPRYRHGRRTGRRSRAIQHADGADDRPRADRARICYDHLAGDLGVQMLDSMKRQRLVRHSKQAIELTAEGKRFMENSLQISAQTLAHPRRPVCKACLDWSERRHHLAGTLGAAVMTRFTELKWAARDSAPGSRVVNFTRNGEKRFAELFGKSE